MSEESVHIRWGIVCCYLVSSASHWGIVYGAPDVCYTYYTRLQYNTLRFGVATTQHVLLQIWVATRSVCRKRLSPSWTRSLNSACETGALPSEVLIGVTAFGGFSIVMYGTTKSAVSPIHN